MEVAEGGPCQARGPANRQHECMASLLLPRKENKKVDVTKERKDTESQDRGSWKLMASVTKRKASFPHPLATEEEQVLLGRLDMSLFRLGPTLSE